MPGMNAKLAAICVISLKLWLPASHPASQRRLSRPAQQRLRGDAAAVGGSGASVATVRRSAAGFHMENKGSWLYAERLGGFCPLAKREVLFDTGILSAKT